MRWQTAARVLSSCALLVAGCSGRLAAIGDQDGGEAVAEASCVEAMCFDAATRDGAEDADDARATADASNSEVGAVLAPMAADGDSDVPVSDSAAPDAAATDAPATDAPATDAALPPAGGSAPVYLIDPAHTSAASSPGLVPPLSRRWTRDLGSPVSYPLIVNGIVYVTEAAGFHIDSGLTALDLATGRTVFSMDLGSETGATTAYDDGRLFVLDEDSRAGSGGQLRALDPLSGSVLWSTPLDLNQGFYDSPPTPYGGLLYVYGIGTGGTLYAYDEATGALRWRSGTTSGNEGSPAVSAAGVFISEGCDATSAFDRETGAPLWTNRGPCTGGSVLSPVISGQSLFIHSQSDDVLDVATGNVLASYQADLPPAFGADSGFFVASGVLHAADPTLTTMRWTFSADGSLTTVPLVVGDVVYVGSSIGTLYAVDVATGTALWSENTGAPLVFREDFASEPRTAFAAGEGALLVPSGQQLIAYGSSSTAPSDAGVSGAGCGWTLAGEPSPPPAEPFIDLSAVSAGDMNGDGRPDVLVARAYAQGSVSVYLGDGDGTFQPPADYPVPTEANRIASADFDGDGRPDVAVTSTYSGNAGGAYTVSVLLNRGDGTLLAPVAYPVGAYPLGVAAADLDADGRVDLVIASETAGVKVLRGRGDGTFDPAATYAAGSEPADIVIGDVDHDGKLDVVTNDAQSGGLLLLSGRGDGTLSVPVELAVPAGAGTPTLGDVNADGNLDLVVSNGLAVGELSVMLGRGDGTLGPATTFEAGASPGALAIADMNHDGHADLVVTNSGSDSVSVLLGNGDGTFQWQLAFPAQQGPDSMVVADWNADSLPDLAIVSFAQTAPTILVGGCAP